MSLCININLSMDIEGTKEKMLMINNLKQKWRDEEVGVMHAQFSELKKDQQDGYQIDVGTLKKAIMGVDPSLPSFQPFHSLFWKKKKWCM